MYDVIFVRILAKSTNPGQASKVSRNETQKSLNPHSKLPLTLLNLKDDYFMGIPQDISREKILVEEQHNTDCHLRSLCVFSSYFLREEEEDEQLNEMMKNFSKSFYMSFYMCERTTCVKWPLGHFTHVVH